MKKFSFNLESLLTLRNWEEQRARAAFAESNARVLEAMHMVDHLEQAIDAAYAAWSPENGSSFSPMDRLALGSQIETIRLQARKADADLDAAQKHREEAMRAVQHATQQRKVVTNLKEKRQREYAEELLKSETNEMEDIFNARRSAV